MHWIVSRRAFRKLPGAVSDGSKLVVSQPGSVFLDQTRSRIAHARSSALLVACCLLSFVFFVPFGAFAQYSKSTDLDASGAYLNWLSETWGSVSEGDCLTYYEEIDWEIYEVEHYWQLTSEVRVEASLRTPSGVPLPTSEHHKQLFNAGHLREPQLRCIRYTGDHLSLG